MFGNATYLISRLMTNSERAQQFATLRRRFARALDNVGADAELERLAHELLALRLELSRSLRIVNACRACVRPRSLEWPGGHCCSGSTQIIFAHEELVALRLTRAKFPFRAVSREPLLGCVFRSHAGCTLKVQCRPCLCVRYTCRELDAELDARGDRPAIVALQKRLRIAFDEFCRALEARQWPVDPFGVQSNSTS